MCGFLLGSVRYLLVGNTTRCSLKVEVNRREVLVVSVHPGLWSVSSGCVDQRSSTSHARHQLSFTSANGCLYVF